MMKRRLWINKFIRVRNIKIAFMLQSIVSTFGVIFMMLQTPLLDQTSRWEMDLTEERCRGCCSIRNESLKSIINEPYLSEKLHKFSRAVRKYDIPEEILNILHEAEHKIEKFENELQHFKKEKFDRISQLQDVLIEEDIKDQDLTPKAKPKWKKQVTNPSKKQVTNPSKKQAKTGKQEIKRTDPPLKRPTRMANDVHKKLPVNIPV